MINLGSYVIETISLKKQFGGQFAVNDVSIHVEHGKIYGLLGRNGAGKTTTMRMIMGLVRPTSGEIRIFGQNCIKNEKSTYRRIGSIIEAPGFYENLTGSENLRIFARLRGMHRKDAVEQALVSVGLDKEQKKLFGNYSQGMKQRLGIAAAIMHEPELLILDEPINGLDPIGISEMRNFLLNLSRDKRTTIMISSHILSEIEQMADTIGVMHEGKVIEEIRMEELRKRNRHYIEFGVSDENKATLLLEERLGLKDYSVHENRCIRIYSHFGQESMINKMFVENEISVSRINVSEEKLEDYFSGLIGGGKIG